MSTTNSITPEEYRALCEVWELDEDKSYVNTPQLVIPFIEYCRNNTNQSFWKALKWNHRRGMQTEFKLFISTCTNSITKVIGREYGAILSV